MNFHSILLGTQNLEMSPCVFYTTQRILQVLGWYGMPFVSKFLIKKNNRKAYQPYGHGSSGTAILGSYDSICQQKQKEEGQDFI